MNKQRHRLSTILQRVYSQQSSGWPCEPSCISTHSGMSWIWRFLHQSATTYNVKHNIWVKVKGQTFVIALLSRQSHRRCAQVHGAHRAASVSHIPALNLPSHSQYLFTNHERMENRVSPGLGCKEKLAHGCYATACVQHDLNPNLAIVSQAR